MKKDDNGKNKLGLLFKSFPLAFQELGMIQTMGNVKYSDLFHDSNWRTVENKEDRYLDACFRHIFEDLQGSSIDQESDCLHLVHAAWNLLALSQLKIEKRGLF